MFFGWMEKDSNEKIPVRYRQEVQKSVMLGFNARGNRTASKKQSKFFTSTESLKLGFQASYLQQAVPQRRLLLTGTLFRCPVVDKLRTHVPATDSGLCQIFKTAPRYLQRTTSFCVSKTLQYGAIGEKLYRLDRKNRDQCSSSSERALRENRPDDEQRSKYKCSSNNLRWKKTRTRNAPQCSTYTKVSCVGLGCPWTLRGSSAPRRAQLQSFCFHRASTPVPHRDTRSQLHPTIFRCFHTEFVKIYRDKHWPCDLRHVSPLYLLKLRR